LYLDLTKPKKKAMQDEPGVLKGGQLTRLWPLGQSTSPHVEHPMGGQQWPAQQQASAATVMVKNRKLANISSYFFTTPK
jgi:hypothetical protein